MLKSSSSSSSSSGFLITTTTSGRGGRYNRKTNLFRANECNDLSLVFVAFLVISFDAVIPTAAATLLLLLLPSSSRSQSRGDRVCNGFLQRSVVMSSLQCISTCLSFGGKNGLSSRARAGLVRRCENSRERRKDREIATQEAWGKVTLGVQNCHVEEKCRRRRRRRRLVFLFALFIMTSMGSGTITSFVFRVDLIQKWDSGGKGPF